MYALLECVLGITNFSFCESLFHILDFFLNTKSTRLFIKKEKTKSDILFSFSGISSKNFVKEKLPKNEFESIIEPLSKKLLLINNFLLKFSKKKMKYKALSVYLYCTYNKERRH